MHILFTSASEPTALALARVLVAEGHTVHAADEEPVWLTAPCRWSRASRFYCLTTTFGLPELWKAIGDDVDLVIPFGPLPGHVIENLRSRGANIIGETLSQNDYEFQDFVRENILNTSSDNPTVVKVPISFTVHSRTCIAEILSNRAASTFSLQPSTCYDTDDEDTLVDVGPVTASSAAVDYTGSLIVSCSTLNDRTVEAIKRLPISDTKPYRLIEVAAGGSFYSAHAFIHTGKIRTFVVTNARGTDKDFVIVSSDQPLYDVLYQFTLQFTEALDSWQTVVANHLSLTFHVHDEIKYGEILRRVNVVSCHNQPHPSLILLSSIPSLRKQLALAYTSETLADKMHSTVQFPTNTRVPKAIYSASLGASEFARIFFGFAPWRWYWWTNLTYLMMMCWVWGVNFKEEMWDFRDPGPALCLWAVMFVKNIGRMRGIKWVMRRIANPQEVVADMIGIAGMKDNSQASFVSGTYDQSERDQQRGIAQVLADEPEPARPYRGGRVWDNGRFSNHHEDERVLSRGGARRVRIDEMDDDGDLVEDLIAEGSGDLHVDGADYFGDSIPIEEPQIPPIPPIPARSPLRHRGSTPELQIARTVTLFALNPDPPSHSNSSHVSLEDMEDTPQILETARRHPSYRLRQPAELKEFTSNPPSAFIAIQTLA
ncbi:hypothetical protein N0V90_003316 [Kalmusia sp. IMI 367209]|nr:hypothetical protein N0V90_003316 [Kalmusia sp. IMI 367209]